jgi:hypothetical protein
MRSGVRNVLVGRVAPLAAAALVLLTVAGFFAIRGGTDTASAAQVRAKLAQGLQLQENVTGTFEVRTRDPGSPPRGAPRCLYCLPQTPLPSEFVIGEDGSYSSTTIPADSAIRHDIAYDASTGVETSLTTSLDPGGQALYLRTVNLDPAFLQYAPEARLGTWVLGAAEAGDPRVEDTTFEGRDAWSLTAVFRPGQIGYDAYGARLEVVVDRATGLVLEVTQYAYDADRWTSVARVRDLEVGGSTVGVDFTVTRPSGVPEVFHDYRFQRMAIDEATETIGYRPLLPSETGGRELADFAVAETSDYPFPGLPARRDVASARYGTGAAALTVSTYRGSVADLPSLLPAAESETVDPADGPLVGSVAHLARPALGGAVFAAFADGLLVRITAPTAEEALAAANSLRPD